MAVNRRRVPVSRQQVWRVLSDGFSYENWVVGARRIRDVDAGFPEPGTRLHYAVGVGPIEHQGHTEVREVEPGRRLVLEAHAWPVGTARIEIRLEDDDDIASDGNDGGCTVTMEERPARGLPAALHNPLQDAVFRARNVVTLRRLERLARERAGPEFPQR